MNLMVIALIIVILRSMRYLCWKEMVLQLEIEWSKLSVLETLFLFQPENPIK